MCSLGNKDQSKLGPLSWLVSNRSWKGQTCKCWYVVVWFWLNCEVVNMHKGVQAAMEESVPATLPVNSILPHNVHTPDLIVLVFHPRPCHTHLPLYSGHFCFSHLSLQTSTGTKMLKLVQYTSGSYISAWLYNWFKTHNLLLSIWIYKQKSFWNLYVYLVF